MPENPYNEYPTNLGRVLSLVYGIDARPYDTELQLWVKVATSLGVSVTPYDDLDAVLSRIADTGGISPSGDAPFSWEPSNADASTMVGLFAYQNASSLPGVTSLTVHAISNREGFDLNNAPDLQAILFPNLVSIDDGGYFAIFGMPSLTTLLLPEFVSVPSDSFVSFGSLGIPSLMLPKLSSGGALTVQNCESLVSASFPSLFTAEPLNIISCALLTTLSLPELIPTNGGSYSFADNALDAASVNDILARGVANPAFASGTLQLQGGTNAAPSGQGIADKATLQGRGVTVTTN